jgi:3-methyladenine DNA glycosylase AlkC
MPEPFKNLINEDFFKRFTNALVLSIPGFDKDSFLHDIYDGEWENRELKNRIRHTTLMLEKQFKQDYRENLRQMLVTLENLLTSKGYTPGFELMIFADFVEVYGLEDYEPSVKAMEKITQHMSCEFAVRPFILRYGKTMMAQMLAWAKHENPLVRRLASEGCRPRLPWAMSLPELKKDPSPVLPILETLKNDVSESVRKSVANNLNDISKDHPELVTDIAKKWIGHSDQTDWVLKHACRTLLKAGNQVVLELFGLSHPHDVEVSNFRLITPKFNIGKDLRFSFEIHNRSGAEKLIRVEYALYFLRSNGSHSKKVFMHSEKNYPGRTSTTIEKTHSFRTITTRKYYPGKQIVAVIINGMEVEPHEFILENLSSR